LTSAVWNLKYRNLSKMISRIGFAFLSFVYSGGSVLHSGFWQAISNPYTSDTFLRGFQKAGLPVTSR
jgi:hypothetical protein